MVFRNLCWDKVLLQSLDYTVVHF